MKVLYKSLCFIAAIAAMSLTSCQKESLKPAEGSTTITVHASVEDVANATKTYIEDDQLYWSENERMWVVTFNDDAEADAAMFGSDSFTRSEDGLTGDFTVKINDTNTNKYIVGITPQSTSVSSDNKKAYDYKIQLPAKQTATAASYDPNAYPLITRPADLPLDNNAWRAFYVRVAALNLLNITNLNDDIRSVVITFPEGQDAAGNRKFDLSKTTPGEIYYGGTNEITVSYGTAIPAATVTKTVWFTSWEVTINPDEKITVKVASDTKTYTKEFTANQEIVLEENFLNTLPIDMSGAIVEEIPAGEDLSGEYLIVGPKSGAYHYMLTETGKDFINGSNNGISKSIENLTCADFYGETNIEDYVWTVTSTNGGYTIQSKSTTKFININSDSAQLEDAEDVLVISKEEDGSYKVQESVGNEYSLCFNNSASPVRFKPYKPSSNQQPIYFIPWVESTEPALIVSETSKTVDATAESVTFEYTTRNIEGDVTATEEADAYNIISNVSATNGVVTVTLTPNTEDKEKTATVKLSATGVEPVILTVIQKAYVTSGMIKFVGFEAEEGYTSGNNYQNDHSQGDWTIIYGAVTTTDKISGAQSLQMRGYTSNSGGESYFMLKEDKILTGVTYITFKATRTSGDLLISHKINDGEWSEPKPMNIGTTVDEYTYVISDVAHSDKVNIKFENSTPKADKNRITVDDISFYNSVPPVE